MTQDTMWKQVAAARERAAGPTRIDVDEVIAGGRWRVRRRRATGVGLGSALVTAAVVGVVTLGTMGNGSEAIDPAGGDVPSASAFEGCTLQPSTCDGDLVADWMRDQLGAQQPTDSGFTAIDPKSPEAARLPDGAWEFTGGEVSLPGDQQQARVELFVAPSSGESRVFDVVDSEPDRAWEERKVEVASGVTAEVSTTGSGGDWFQLWAVREGPGHGSIVLVFEGTKVPGWSDEHVRTLLTTLLTEASTSA